MPDDPLLALITTWEREADEADDGSGDWFAAKAEGLRRCAGDLRVALEADEPHCPALRAELADVRAALELEVSRRTVGGSPLAVNEVEWTNRKLSSPAPGADGAV